MVEFNLWLMRVMEIMRSHDGVGDDEKREYKNETTMTMAIASNPFSGPQRAKRFVISALLVLSSASTTNDRNCVIAKCCISKVMTALTVEIGRRGRSGLLFATHRGHSNQSLPASFVPPGWSHLCGSVHRDGPSSHAAQ